LAAVKLYLDQNIDPALAHVLRSKGFDVLSTYESGLAGREDEEQLEYAISQKRALLTFNAKDFAPLAEIFYEQEKEHFGIILSAQYGVPFKELVHLTSNLLQKTQQEDLMNCVVWLQSYR